MLGRHGGKLGDSWGFAGLVLFRPHSAPHGQSFVSLVFDVSHVIITVVICQGVCLL